MSGARVSFGNIQMHAGASEHAHSPGSTAPFRILVMGDFTGRENCERNEPATLASRPLINIDRDNVEDVLERLDVRLNKTLLTGEGEHVSVEFKNLDDFHPDELFDRLDIFASLRKLRRQLLNPNTCTHAIEEIDSWQTGDITLLDDDDDDDGDATPNQPAADSVDQGADEANSGYSVEGLFDDYLASAEASPTDLTKQWNDVIQDLVGQYAEKPVDPQRDEYVAMVDGAIQRAMRALMHHPHFADLEAIWRAVNMMVRRVETSSKLSIQVVDISKTELTADLNGHDDLSESQVYQMLVERTVGTPGGKPWTIVVGAFDFAPVASDLDALGRLGAIAAAANSCCLTSVGGSPDFWCDAEQIGLTDWMQIAESPGASHLGVVWPRFLARLPYGKKTSSTEKIDFEEVEGEVPDECLLWGHGAVLAALGLAQQFSANGWEVDPSTVMTHQDMPLLIQDVQGDSEIRATGKYLMTDKQIGVCLSAGIVPLVSLRNRNEVMFQGMQSAARTPLQGAWS